MTKPAAATRTLIRSEELWAPPDLRELWRTRELLKLLIISEFKARHRQTVVGASWVLIQPILAMVVFSVIFGHFGNFPSDGLPYPIFFFSGFVVWQFFQKGLGSSVPSLAISASIIGKVYFPRFHVLVAPIGTNMIDFAMSGIVLVVLYAYYGLLPSWPIVFLPLFLLMALLTVVAVSTWLAPLNISYRDIQVALPSLLQFWFFVTPVVYPVLFIPESVRVLLFLNPMTAVIEGCRWGLVGTQPPSLLGIAISCGVIFALLVPGSIYFNHAARTMVDRI